MITATTISATASQPGFRRVAAEINYGWWRKETLWFDVPTTVAPSATDVGNAWLTALLPFAFESGQPLKINAPVDEILLQNAAALQRVWAEWFPGRPPVRLTVEPAAGERSANGHRTGCFFTGGVDSFFSLLHFDATGGGQKVDDLIYVWGCDIPLKNPLAFAGKTKSLNRVATQLGKTVVLTATNLRQTRLGQLDWGLWMHGPTLAAVGLLLESRFKKILVSASHSPTNLCVWGSHPLTTPLMSSRNLEIIYYGSRFLRVEKTALIADSAVAMENLHVCWKGRNELNCGHCGKCYTTLTTLELLNRRPQATSFPQANFSLETLKTLKLASAFGWKFFAEIAQAARERNRPDIAEAVAACLAANQHLK